MAAGAAAASGAWIQLLFQRDNATLPVTIGLPLATVAVVGGAVAVQVGARMARR